MLKLLKITAALAVLGAPGLPLAQTPVNGAQPPVDTDQQGITGTGSLPKMKQAGSASASAPVYNQNQPGSTAPQGFVGTEGGALPKMKQAGSASASAPVYNQNQPGETVPQGFVGTEGGALPKMKQAGSASASAPVYNQNHLGSTVQKTTFSGTIKKGKSKGSLTTKGSNLKMTKSLPSMKQAGSASATAPVYNQNHFGGTAPRPVLGNLPPNSK